jgi:two-component system, sensor histidine kinase and response regulator
MSADSSPIAQVLSLDTFNQLQLILEQTAGEVQAGLWTEASLTAEATEIEDIRERFLLVVSPVFSALLQGQSQTPHTALTTHLTFEPGVIRQFIQDLLNHNQLVPAQQDRLQASQSQVQLNDAVCQSQFTLKLASLLTLSAQCQSTEAALRQQVEQEHLLNQVTTQIRQSLELPVILKTAVEQVRECLQADRLVIYQLGGAAVMPLLQQFNLMDWEEMALSNEAGSVVYEACASETIPSVMNLSDTYCLIDELRNTNWHTIEIASAVDDVEVQYTTIPCLLDFLRQARVRAKLIAPIRLQNQIWGLLIAHSCDQPRHWQDSERRFLQQIAENLAIAISQAQLYAELQQQKQTLEQQVVERTQALQDAMLAAQSANRAKSEFLAMVSHELRTPLTCIIGMSATLQRWSKETLNERQQSFLQMIHESGGHLLALINDILDLSQAEAGRMLLALKEFSLSRVSQQTLKVFEGQAALQGLQLELDLHIDPTYDRFMADSRRVRQILFNLLSNAVKFTPEGGKVTLRVFAQSDVAVFQVVDTGIGIAEAQLPLLFQKFQQLDSTHQREYQGTGLGLALTKQLVELHGGWIEVESTLNVGSMFTVRLPMQRLTAISYPHLADNPPLQQRQGRIVLVEPSEEIAGFLCDLLLAAGYQVIWVLEGSVAMNQLEVLLPAAVIVNLWLPDLDGAYLIRHLRQNPSTKQLKILAMIPLNASAEVRASWQTTEADDALDCPIQPEVLLQTLKRLLTLPQTAL